MQEKSKQIHLLKEDSDKDCRIVTSSSWEHLWQVLAQPLMRHWAIYDCLMTIFFMIVFALLFSNFV